MHQGDITTLLRQGSVRALTDGSGELQNRYGYRAFGETLSSLTSISTQQPYQFTGERLDSLTGYNYLRARMYDPRIGRFTSFDPAEDFNNRLHKYVYCANDPVNSLDFSGLMTSTEIIATAKISTIIGSIIGISAGTYVGYKENRGLLGTAQLIGLYSLFFACVTYLIIAYPKLGINAAISGILSVIMSFPQYKTPSDYINAFMQSFFLAVLSGVAGAGLGAFFLNNAAFEFKLIKAVLMGFIIAGILVLKWRLTGDAPEDESERRWRFWVAFGIGVASGLVPLPETIKDNAEARAFYTAGQSIMTKMVSSFVDKLLAFISKAL